MTVQGEEDIRGKLAELVKLTEKLAGFLEGREGLIAKVEVLDSEKKNLDKKLENLSGSMTWFTRALITQTLALLIMIIFAVASWLAKEVPRERERERERERAIMPTVSEELASLGARLFREVDIGSDRYKSQVVSAVYASVPFIIVDLDTGFIMSSGPLADLMFGYIQGELARKQIHDLVPERLREGHRLHFAQFREHPTQRQMGKQPMELSGVKRDGSEFPVEISLHPQVVDGRRSVVGLILDMSGRAKGAV